MDLGEQHVEDVRAREGHLAREKLESHRCKRIDVGSGTYSDLSCLFRRHVGDGAGDEAALAALRLVREEPGEAEVGQDGIAAGAQKDVRGLYVAVDDLRPVGVVDPTADSAKVIESLARLQRTIPKLV